MGLCETYVIGPSIIINDPDDYDIFGYLAPSFNVLINDPNGIESKWYTLDGGITNTSFSSNGIINQTRWNDIVNGSVIITFYANDSLGNIGFSEVYIYKDIIAPSITINWKALSITEQWQLSSILQFLIAYLERILRVLMSK